MAVNTTLTYPRFLRDVFILSISTFGGPQSHIAYFQRLLVERRKYITEAELIEVNSLGQVLPGPTSTQTLTAVAFKLRGPSLAYLTLLVWMLPAVGIMTAAALLVSHLEASNTSMSFTRFIQPMAVGLVAHAAYTIIRRTVHTRTGVVLLVIMASAAIGWLLTFDRMPEGIVNWAAANISQGWLVILLMNGLMLLCGMFIDLPAAVLLLTPVFMPLATSIGMDPVQLGIVMTVNLAIGLYTPPVGTTLFITSAVAKVKVGDTVREMGPFYLVAAIVLLLVSYVPALIIR